MPRSFWIFCSVTLFSLTWLSTPGLAQDRHFPLHHRQPTGMAGEWSLIAQPQGYWYAQPVDVVLPSSGNVTFFQGSPGRQVAKASPATVGMMVGRVYRVKISNLPEFPGAELYPTIELLDRLHPPGEQVDAYSIPIEITAEEIEIVLQDRMVTKVIYLEQPDLAAPFVQEDQIRIEDLPVSENLLKAADERGRPMAILRIGGRIPDPRSQVDEFYSSSPLLFPED